jgi:hypothetical protein
MFLCGLCTADRKPVALYACFREKLREPGEEGKKAL